MTEVPVKTKTNYPVSVEEAKRHLRIDDSWDKDDDYIRNLIKAATQKAEEYIGKDIAETSNVLKIRDYAGSDFYVQEGNFISLTSVQQSDEATSITVDHTEIYYNQFYVELSSSVSQDPLYINYKTGFLVNTVPALIKQAILVKIGDLYDSERGSYLAGSYKETNAWQHLLDSFKLVMY